MSTFVLVPGAWLGGWAWSAVAADLRDRGHDVHALTLTGLAERVDEATAATDLSTHVDDVLAVLDSNDLHDVILVGHSYAGAVISGVAQRAPERIGRLVYLAAVVLPDGASLFDVLGPEAQAGMEAAAVLAGDPLRLPFVDRDQLDLYYGSHGLDDEMFATLAAKATAHPIGTHRERLVLRNARAEALARTYVRATADWPSAIGPTTPGWDYLEIETGHWPMFTKPVELAALLDGLAVA
jgi:pimeloyl-ACP methyl ester carboxylesterase